MADITQTAMSDNDDCSRSRSGPIVSVTYIQKMIAEFVGVFCVVFAGCSAIVVNKTYGEVVTLPGIALTFGLTVTVMTYSVGHVSGAHFNPAVSIALATCRKFPFYQVPGYIAAQVLGSTLASAALRFVHHLQNDVCSLKGDVYVGTIPSHSVTTAFVVEFIVTFYLLFVVSAVATDERAAKPFAGVSIGATVTLTALFAAPISGASLNPARSLGPAIIWDCYNDIWLYIVAPVLGGLAGAWTYGMLRSTNKSFGEIVRPSCNKV